MRDAVLIGTGVVAVIVLVVLALLPVAHSYSLTLISSLGTNGNATFSPPKDSAVSGSWSASGGVVTFTVLDFTGYPIYSSTGTAGSFSFPAMAPPYTFSTSSVFLETVSVTGSYSSPIL